ncbi:MAG: ATP-grasp domain-containing protein [candidate division NC10 bacterium]|nr:ATP-grasp domain-containing protein [candidate division NC10 bacterium]
MDILIVGVSARGLAESAVRSGLGHRILAVDHFGDFDLRLLCENRSIKRDLGLPYDVRHLITASRDLTFDGLAYVANLENHPSAVETLGHGKTLLGNGASVLSSVRDPSRFFGFLGRAGIPAPKISFSSKMFDRDPEIRWLRKPVRSGGGHGIAVHIPVVHLGPGMFLQEYLDGLPCAAVFAANGLDACLLGISEQLVGEKEFGAGGFRYCGSILGPVVPGKAGWRALIESVHHIVRAITREFHLVGVNGMDFILKGGAALPLEVNPRYTASMELTERAYGINIFDAHVAACQGRLPAFDLGAQSAPDFLGKAILFATEDLVFHNPRWWYERGARDLPFEGEPIARGKPICTVFSRGRSRPECYDELTKAAAEVVGATVRSMKPVEQIS